MATAFGATRPLPSAKAVIDVGSVAPEIFSTNFMVADEMPASSHAPHKTNAVYVYKRVNSSTIARLSKKTRRNTSTALAKAVVNEEYVLDVTYVAESLHLSPGRWPHRKHCCKQ